MPFKDPAKATDNARERQRRHRIKRHVERFGPDAGDMRGRHGNQAKGSSNGRWNSDRLLSSHGYVLVRVGADHPLAFGNGYAYEHLVVWAASGRELPRPDELIHHANEDKTDNRLGNLEKITRSEHGEIHIAGRDRDAAGRLLDGRTWDEVPS